MNKIIKVFSTVIISFLITYQLFAFSKRVNQLPNGSKFSCSNCHVSSGGGGTRTQFGNDVMSGHLDTNGDVEWSQTLANIDSDGDEASNGLELQDPDGSWQTGQPQPGYDSLVTNPGDASSFPVEVSVSGVKSIALQFKLEQNFPNPFNAETVMKFSIPADSDVTLEVYNLSGKLVTTLMNTTLREGMYSIAWDGKDQQNKMVSSGIYFYRIKAGGRSIAKSMLFMR